MSSNVLPIMCDGNHDHKHTPIAFTESTIKHIGEMFKVFSDQTRLRILTVLLGGDFCVCELAETVEMEQSAVSHQLRKLKEAGLVKSERDGRQIRYSLDDDHVRLIIEVAASHVLEVKK